MTTYPLTKILRFSFNDIAISTPSEFFFAYFEILSLRFWTKEDYLCDQGCVLSVYGENLNGAPIHRVQVGNLACSNVDVISANSFRCILPPNQLAMEDIRVDYVDRSVSLPLSYSSLPDWNIQLGICRNPLAWFSAKDFLIEEQADVSVRGLWTSGTSRGTTSTTTALAGQFASNPACRNGGACVSVATGFTWENSAELSSLTGVIVFDVDGLMEEQENVTIALKTSNQQSELTIFTLTVSGTNEALVMAENLSWNFTALVFPLVLSFGMSNDGCELGIDMQVFSLPCPAGLSTAAALKFSVVEKSCMHDCQVRLYQVAMFTFLNDRDLRKVIKSLSLQYSAVSESSARAGNVTFDKDHLSVVTGRRFQVSGRRDEESDGWAVAYIRSNFDGAIMVVEDDGAIGPCNGTRLEIILPKMELQCKNQFMCWNTSECLVKWAFFPWDQSNRSLYLRVCDGGNGSLTQNHISLEIYRLDSSYGDKLGPNKVIDIFVEDVLLHVMRGIRLNGSNIEIFGQEFLEVGYYTVFYTYDCPGNANTTIAINTSWIDSHTLQFPLNDLTTRIPQCCSDRASVELKFSDTQWSLALVPYKPNSLGGCEFSLEYWTMLSVPSASAGGLGENLTISGYGFDPSSAYSCLWYAGSSIEESPARLLSSSSLECLIPSWPHPVDAMFQVQTHDSCNRTRNLTRYLLNSSSSQPNLCLADNSPFEFHFKRSISAFSPLSVAAAGASVITLEGVGFSACQTELLCVFDALDSSHVTVKQSPLFYNDTYLTCETPFWPYDMNTANVSLDCGSNVLFTVLPEPSSVNFITFLPCTISALEPSKDLASTGNESLLITGSNFGIRSSNFDSDVSKRFVIGKTSCSSVEWIADSSLVCVTSAGESMMGSLGVELTLANRTCYNNEIRVLYSPPEVFSLNLTRIYEISSPTESSSKMLQLFGKGFGPSLDYPSSIVVGNESCTPNYYFSDSHIMCNISDQLFCDLTTSSAFFDFDVTLGNVSLKFAQRFEAMELKQAIPNQVSTSGQRVTVVGNFFLDGQYDLKVGASACTSIGWESDSAVSCVVPPGTGSVPLTVTLADCHLKLNSLDFAYLNADVTSINPSVLALRTTSVTLYGSNFGVFNTQHTVSISGQSCENVSWISDSSISCSISLSSASGEAIVVDGVTVNPISLRILTNPLINDVVPTTLKTFNGTGVIHFSAIDDYLKNHSFSVRMGQTTSEFTEWIDDMSLKVLVPPGTGTELQGVTLTLNNISYTFSSLWKYSSPAITTTEINNTLGVVEIQGENFGAYDATPSSFVGLSACLSTTWTSDSLVQCRVVQGAGRNLPVTVVVSGASGSKENAYEYPTPLILEVSTARGTSSEGYSYLPSAGRALVSIVGAQFPQAYENLRVKIGEHTCERVDRVSETVLASDCIIDQFQVAYLNLSVTSSSGLHLQESNAVTVGVSSPTCDSIKNDLQTIGLVAASGAYLLDPNFGPSADSVSSFCSMGFGPASSSREMKPENHLGTSQPPWLWLDPDLDDSMELICPPDFNSAWNTSTFSVAHGVCSTITKIGSRSLDPSQGLTVTFTNEGNSSSIPERRFYRTSTIHAYIYFNGESYLSTRSILQDPSSLSIFLAVRIQSLQAGWLVGYNDLYASVPRGLGIKLNEQGRVVVEIGYENMCTSTASLTLDAFHVVTLHSNGSSFSLRLDDQEQCSFALASKTRGLLFAVASLVMGRRATLPDQEPYFKGDLGDVIILNNIVTSEMLSVERYLCLKWSNNCNSSGSWGEVHTGEPSLRDQEIIFQVERIISSDGYLFMDTTCSVINGEPLDFYYRTTVLPELSGSVTWKHGESGLKNLSLNYGGKIYGSYNIHLSCCMTLSDEFFQIPGSCWSPSLQGVVDAEHLPRWYSFYPTTSLTRGGGNVTINGQRFDTSSKYECTWTLTNFLDVLSPETSITVTASFRSSTALICDIPEWKSNFLTTRVTFFENGVLIPGNGSSKFEYTRPYVSNVVPLSTSVNPGGSIITIHGAGFGYSDSSPCVSLDANKADYTVWRSDNVIEAKISSGAGKKQICVQIGSIVGCVVQLQVSFSSASSDNDVRFNNLVSLLQVPSTGVLGLTSSRRLLSSLQTFSAFVIVGSFQEVIALQSLVNTLATSNQSAFSIQATGVGFAYAAPNIHNVSLADCSLLVEGKNFGFTDFSPVIRAGGQDCAISTWLSDTSARCQTIPLFGEQTVEIEVASQASNDFLFQFPVPRVFTLQDVHCQVLCEDYLTIAGDDFSFCNETKPQVHIGNTECQPVLWVSDSSIRCGIQHGDQDNLNVVLDFSLGLNKTSRQTIETKFSYDLPHVTGMLPTAGSPNSDTNVTIFGKNFGLAVNVNDNFLLKIDDYKCESQIFVSDSSMRCTFRPQRSSPQYPYLVVNGRRAIFRDNTTLFSYQSPSVSSLNKTITKGESVTVTGSAFGTALPADFRIFVGKTICQTSDWISDTAALCNVPAGAGSVSLHVIRWSASGASALVDYSSLSVTEIVPNNGPAAGGIAVTLLGQGFGPSPDEQTYLTSKEGSWTGACQHWTSDSSLGCDLPPLTSFPQSHILTVGGLSVTLSDSLFLYDYPVIDSVEPKILPPTGFPYFTITGKNFGVYPSLARFSNIGGMACLVPGLTIQGLGYVSDSTLICGVQPGTGGNTPLEVKIEGRSSFLPNAFELAPEPKVKGSIQSDVYPQQFGGNITVFGNFTVLNIPTGQFYKPPISIHVGKSTCLDTTWLSDWELRCRVVPGEGRRLDISVQIYQAFDTLREAFSYLSPPQISGLEPSATVVSGGDLLTIFGSDFQTKDFSPTAFVGDTRCSMSMWVSDSSMYCSAPKAQLQDDVPVSVVVRGQVGEFLPGVKYSGFGLKDHLGISYPIPLLWMDASLTFFFEVDSVLSDINYVKKWKPRIAPPQTSGGGEFYFSQPEKPKRPHLTSGFVRFDGMDDSLVANQNLLRPNPELTIFMAVRPVVSYSGTFGKCIARPVIWVSNDGKTMLVQSKNDSVLEYPSSANLNPKFYIEKPNGLMLVSSYVKIVYLPREIDIPGRFQLTAPPGVTYPRDAGLYFALPSIASPRCSPGWILSDNSLNGEGAGVYIDEVNYVRPVVGYDAFARSNEPIQGDWRILTLTVRKHGDNNDFYRLYVDNNIDEGFDLSAVNGIPDVLSPTSLMSIGAQSLNLATPKGGNFHGDIGEIIVFNEVLDDVKLSLVYRALCGKWESGCAANIRGGAFAFSWSNLPGLNLLQSVTKFPMATISRLNGSDGFARVKYSAHYFNGTENLTLSGADGIVDWAHGDNSSRYVGPFQFVTGRNLVEEGSDVFMSISLEKVASDFSVAGGEFPFTVINDFPTVQRLLPSTGATRGGTRLTISGSKFGRTDTEGFLEPAMAPYRIEAFLGNSRCPETTWVSETSIVVEISRGGHDFESTQLMIRISSPCPSYMDQVMCDKHLIGPKTWYLYAAPQVTSVKPTDDISPYGNRVLTVFGENFGYSNSDVVVSMGGTRCKRNAWISDTSIQADIPSGSGSRKAVSVDFTGDQTQATLQDAFSFNPLADIVDLSVHNGPNAGSNLLVLGTNFGMHDFTPIVQIGYTLCQTSQWLSQTSVACQVARGHGRELAVTFHSDVIESSTLSRSYSYDTIKVTTVYRTNGPLVESIVKIQSIEYSFPVNDFSPPENSTSNLVVTQWISDTTIMVRLESSFAPNLDLVVQGTLKEVSLPKEFFTFDNPSLQAVVPSFGPTSGNFNVTVLGLNFGTSEYSTATITIGQSDCVHTYWTSDSRIVCTVSQGSGYGREVNITRSYSQSVELFEFSYLPPSVSSLNPSNAPANAENLLLSIFGANLGTLESPRQIHVGATACSWVEFMSESSLNCRLSPGTGAMKYVAVVVDDQNASSLALSYDAPYLSSLSYDKGPDTGNFSFVMYGSNFGTNARVPRQVTIGPTRCQTISWLSDSAMECRAQAGDVG
eukprot:718314-Hanusia_phi.AAC.1